MGAFGFFISQLYSLAGLSGPVHRMITALIKDGLGLWSSPASLIEHGIKLTEPSVLP